MIKELKGNIIYVFKNDYNRTINEENIKLLDSSNNKNDKYKLSYHVIITTENPQLLFRTNKAENSAYHLAKRLIDINPIYKDFIDTAVYSTDRSMRCIGSFKSPSDLRKLIPIDFNNNEVDYIITGYDLTKRFEYITVPYIYNQTVAKETATKKIKNKVNAKNISSDDDRLKKILDLVQNNIHKTAVLTSVNENDGIIYYSFNYTDRTETLSSSSGKTSA